MWTRILMILSFSFLIASRSFAGRRCCICVWGEIASFTSEKEQFESECKRDIEVYQSVGTYDSYVRVGSAELYKDYVLKRKSEVFSGCTEVKLRYEGHGTSPTELAEYAVFSDPDLKSYHESSMSCSKFKNIDRAVNEITKLHEKIPDISISGNQCAATSSYGSSKTPVQVAILGDETIPKITYSACHAPGELCTATNKPSTLDGDAASHNWWLCLKKDNLEPVKQYCCGAKEYADHTATTGKWRFSQCK